MAKGQMVINYVPGEECRVAVVGEGKLNELHAERMDNVSHVGNIYVGRVVNVEAAIQAAFVDFGLEHNGFLHVSDLHPQYFPDADGDTTERVGKKTPRRDRPPIQECLRRGQEIAVQVLKEGVGTKGPTVTSYLSIPGRFLVMMPQMDRVGVSRKVEDEETRRKMREILDQLDLPEGFGFILRTAGMDRGKLELKRDLAYLQRLWKDMEKRWKSGNKPRLLYSESDLLVRALRDILSSDIEEVVVDNDAAMSRAAKFLKIVAPRSTSRLIHYTGRTPIFHAMGLEEQIQMIHAREVPLPSGGRLVIDETEALVAIDVNSGKSRDARDAETNAYRTNMEATEEICRQLRLRDLGGVIVNDLIDMRFAKHRREVENLWKELLKKDRARWTIAPISEFGILEMTRQRMRGSHESQHFADCPTCRGRGLVQRPDSVAADGLRELAAILDHERVYRIEMVVSPRIASEFLSTKRRALSRIERTSGKHVDVRVSEAIPVDRVTFYAYDDRGADIDLTKLGRHKIRPDEMIEFELTKSALADDWAAEVEGVEPEPVEDSGAPADIAPHPIEIDSDEMDGEWGSPQPARAGGRRGQQPSRPPRPARQSNAANPAGPVGADSVDAEGGRTGRGRRRRRGRRGGGRGVEGIDAVTSGPDVGPAPRGNGRRAAPHDQPPGEGVEHAPSADDLGSDLPYSPRDAEPGVPVGPNDLGGHAMNNGHAPMTTGEPGEAGGRRRRRRRRGRGGRGGADAGGPPSPGFADGQGAGGFPGDDGRGAATGGEPRSDQGVDSDAPVDGEGGDQGMDQGAGQGPRLDGPAGPGQEEDGETGERRRRRRRRRGGRGRNRADGLDGPRSDGGMAPPMKSTEPDGRGGLPDEGRGQADSRGPGGEFSGGPAGNAAVDDQSGGDDGPRTSPDGDAGDGEAGGSAQGGSAQGGSAQGGSAEGEPRRRRRRRGRGQGSGEGMEGGPPPIAPARPAGDRAPRQPATRSPAPSSGRAQPATRGPAPASGPSGAAKKPRTLYSSRRKLGPSERRPAAGDE